MGDPKIKPLDQKLYDSIVKKIKLRVDRWPSAYASGRVVKEYKDEMKKKGLSPYIDEKPKDGLTRWFKEDWVDISTGKPCGSVKSNEYYPICRPSKQISIKTPVTIKELTSDDKKTLIKRKQILKEKTSNIRLSKK